jgi:hypothetical protein
LRALIPAEVFKIDSMSTATPAQLRQSKDGLAITEASNRSGAELPAKKQTGN